MRRKALFGASIVILFFSLLLLVLKWPTVAAQQPWPTPDAAPSLAALGAGSLSPSAPANVTSELVLRPSDDAAVQEGAPNTPDLNNFYLGAGYYENFPFGSDGRVRTYMRFDLSDRLANRRIISATLHIYHAGGADYRGRTRDVVFYRVTGDWNSES